MQRVVLSLCAAAALYAFAPSASAETVSLTCSNANGVSYALTIDYTAATVAIRDFGTYAAQIGEREITWTGARQTFYRLYRDTGRWEIHNADGAMSVLQCEVGAARRF